MFILLGLIIFLTLEIKHSRRVASIFSLVTLAIFGILNHRLANSQLSLVIYFLLSFLCAVNFGLKYKIQFKRKFYFIPVVTLPVLGLLLNYNLNPVYGKNLLLPLFTGLILGLLTDMMTNLPYGFVSVREFFLFKNYSRNNIKPSLIECLKINITNLVTTKEFLTLLNNSESISTDFQTRKTITDSLFYWTQQVNFNSLHPLVQKFNCFSMEQIKSLFLIYDLEDKDVDLIFNMFRCGCWKPGLFILDQYLIANKLSAKYPSTLIFADKLLHDLKKVSFEDESIEAWLYKYRDTFKDSPISQKIGLIYHNKEDWFYQDVRHAVI